MQASLDVADPSVSPRRASAARDEVTEDEWGPGHRPDPLGIVKAGRHAVRVLQVIIVLAALTENQALKLLTQCSFPAPEL